MLDAVNDNCHKGLTGVLAVLLAGQAMATMDDSILAVAAPSLRADLHASGADVQLVMAMYTMALAALVVTGARLGDIVGPRRAFIRGLAVFTFASLAGGLAPNAGALIAARTLQGAAAAIMTPQVLSIIQQRFEGAQRARAIGAYSMILAAGVAAGQIIGGLVVSAHLLAGAWRPALLVNTPVGGALLLVCRRALPPAPHRHAEGLDLGGAALIATTLLALIVPLTLGRSDGWPAWAWASLAAGAVGAWAFFALERRMKSRGSHPLFDVGVLALPGVAAGTLAVTLVMACYAGFLLALTLHLQTALNFSPLHAGLIFALYATGFGTASLTWTRVPGALGRRLPVAGPLLMGTTLLAVGLLASGGDWALLPSIPLLLVAGAGHAWAFAPLVSRLSATVSSRHSADLSGLIITADWVGTAVGVPVFTGIYLTAERHGSGGALELTCAAIALALLVTAACASRALTHATATASPTATAIRPAHRIEPVVAASVPHARRQHQGVGCGALSNPEKSDGTNPREDLRASRPSARSRRS